MNCYVCHLPTLVSIPEAQDSACLVPCCQKCLQSYSVEGAITASASKVEREELFDLICDKLDDLREKLCLQVPLERSDELKEISELLYKLEKELE